MSVTTRTTKNIALAVSLGLAFMAVTPTFAADEPYIPLVSKAFQHRFWQAVKSCAEQAAKDFHVKATFEGLELGSGHRN